MAVDCHSCKYAKDKFLRGYVTCQLTQSEHPADSPCSRHEYEPGAVAMYEDGRRKEKENLVMGSAVLLGGAAYLLSRHQEKKSQGPDPRVAAQRSQLKRNKWIAALLAIFLGWTGAQKFYLDRPKQGIILLVISLVGSLVIIGPIITTAIGIVEGIKYLASSPEEFQKTYVTGNKVWF